ncbi:MAG: hypothetical protein ACYC6N_02435 [Pirellulaceae bacterium]
MVEPPSTPERSLLTRRKQPPDYFSRHVQVRVLILVFLLLAVMKLMEEARQPANWRWMWQFGSSGSSLDSRAPSTDGGPAGNPWVDTRPTPQPVAEMPIVSSPTEQLASQDLLAGPLESSLHATQLRGWTAALDGLEPSQRDLMREGMWAYRHRHAMSSDDRSRWLALCDALTRQWAQYQGRAEQAVEQDQKQGRLTETQRRLCEQVLVTLESRWQQQLAALTMLSQPVSLSDQQAAALAELQQVLDERGWQAVEDNTVLRAAENDAWYRSWEQVESPRAARSQNEAIPVSFVQLFSQPEVYRGQSVRITGTARLGYHVASRTGRFGIDGYYVLWIRPADGTDSPIAAYVRTLPAGFPPLAPRIPNQDATPLHEEITVTGLFFKRWLYGSRSGPNLAPLVLGQVTQWRRPTAPAGADPAPEISRGRLLALGLLGVGAVYAAWRYGRKRRSWAPGLPVSPRPDALPSFDASSVRMPVRGPPPLQHEDEHV